jgi:hypothetical protein
MAQNTQYSITEFLRGFLCEGLDQLLEHPSGEVSTPSFEQLRIRLEALPLDSTEFSLAANRLANAQHYLDCGEPGAARYELRLLRRSLRQ